MVHHRGDNRQHGEWSFLLRSFLMASVPVAVLVLIYIIVDPHGVVAGQPHIVNCRKIEPHSTTSFNKGWLSLIALDRRVTEGTPPDSFIFGSSISCYYESDYWARFIDCASAPVHFDSAAEGATSLRCKIEYLKDNDFYIRNALIVLDPRVLELPLTGSGIASIDHPALAGWATWPRWLYVHFSAFYDPDFLMTYIPGALDLSSVTYGASPVFEPQPIVYDMQLNEESLPRWDHIIETCPGLFYARDEFDGLNRSTGPLIDRLDADRENEYRRIALLLRDTDYKVVVTPTLTHDTLSARDDRLLREIFGSHRYYNLTREMAGMTLDLTNWYDSRHYRATVTRKIIDRLYKAQ